MHLWPGTCTTAPRSVATPGCLGSRDTAAGSPHQVQDPEKRAGLEQLAGGPHPQAWAGGTYLHTSHLLPAWTRPDIITMLSLSSPWLSPPLRPCSPRGVPGPFLDSTDWERRAPQQPAGEMLRRSLTQDKLPGWVWGALAAAGPWVAMGMGMGPCPGLPGTDGLVHAGRACGPWRGEGIQGGGAKKTALAVCGELIPISGGLMHSS